MAASFPELVVSFGGTEYRCAVTFEVMAHIEQRVVLQQLAETITSAPEELKHTEVVWLFYCLLHAAGCAATPNEVWQAVRAAELGEDQIAAVMGFVVGEVYGVGPETVAK